jgi:hypothetical protein
MRHKPIEASDVPGDGQLALLWSVAVRVLFVLGAVNLLLAVLAWGVGPAIHPLLSASDAWVMFAVTAAGLFGNGIVLLVMRRCLFAALTDGIRPHCFLRLPLVAALSSPRRRARLHSRARPAPRRNPPLRS